MNNPGISVFLIVLLYVNLNTFCEELDISKKARQWFEWGEYPKIIHNVPEYLSDSTCSLGTVLESELHLYLGVAYFAEGEVGKARDEFLSSLQLNPDITLEENYVSPEIFDLFRTTVRGNEQRIAERRERDLLLKKKERVSIEREAVIDSLGLTVKRVRKRGFLFTAITTTVLSVGFAGVSAYEYLQGDKKYDKFLAAAERGDLQEYDRLKDEVKMYDNRVILTGSVSAACAISSAIFYIVAHRQRSRTAETVSKKITIDFAHNHISVTYSF